MKRSLGYRVLAGFTGAFLAVVPLVRGQAAINVGAGGAMNIIPVGPAAAPLNMEKGTNLGLIAQRVTSTEAADLKLPNKVGIRVTSVTAGSPAEKAGIQKGDILDKCDDQLLITPVQLIVLVRLHKADDKIKLGVVREDKHLDITATLNEADVLPLETQVVAEGGSGLLGPGNVNVVGMPGGVFIVGGGGFPGGGTIASAPPVVATQPPAAGPVQSVWSDDKHAMTLTTNAGKPVSLVIKDKTDNDKVIFDGPVATEDQQAKIPADLQGAFKTLVDSVNAAAAPAAPVHPTPMYKKMLPPVPAN